MADNIVLALSSIHYHLTTYLDTNGWRNKYNACLESSKELEGKSIVESVKDSRHEIGLPLVVLGVGFVSESPLEIGSSIGTDEVQISIIVYALNNTQLITLANAIRRYLTSKGFAIYNFSGGNPINNSVVGYADMANITISDFSDRNSSNAAERHVNIINAIMEINSNSNT